MAFELKFNSADVKRITGKINKLKANCNTAKGSPIAQFVITLADQYGKAIQSVMGVVDETGGSATSSSFLGTNFQVGWIGLSERTIKLKRANGLTLEIWKATGQTQKAVKTKTFNIPYRELSVFSGIDRSTDEEAYTRAMNNEYGWYTDPKTGAAVDGNKRALFTLANEAFKSQSGTILAEIRKIVMGGVNWGS